MKKLLVYILAGFISCTADKKATPENPQDTTQNAEASATATGTDFEKFVSMLPKLKMPYEANCEDCCEPTTDYDYDNELIKRFMVKGSTMIGLLSKTNDQIALLVTFPGDWSIPTIRVYDLDGTLKGEQSFMTGYCGDSPDFIGKQYFKINEDLSVISIDTSYQLAYDTITREFSDTVSVEIKNSKLVLDENGKFVALTIAQ